jgi:radical SAM superfamily enzyme YgiQ (UPF0313 family)
MRIALIDPALPSRARTVYAGYNVLEPLGLQYIGGAVKSLGHDVHVFSENFLGSDLLDQVLDFRPQLIGMTSLTCNVPHVVSLARQIKSERDCILIVGGYHASGAPEDLAAHEEIDYVVIGEGEKVAAQFAEADEPTATIAGSSKIIRAPRVQDFGELSWPLRDPSLLSHCRILGVMDPPPSRQTRVASVSASRGCPNKCSYCATSSVWAGRQVVLRPEDDLHRELIYLQEELGVDAVFLSDLTLNCSDDHVRNVCRSFSRLQRRLPWYCMCQLKSLPTETLALMAASGCCKIGLGLETPVPEYRRQIKGATVGFERTLNQIIADAHQHGIFVKVYLMVGYPWETQETLDATHNAIMRHAFDEIKVSFYTPFPGTRDFEQHKNRLATLDWSDFDTVSTPVIRMQGVNASDLIAWRTDLFRSYYGSQAYRDLLTTWNRRESRFTAAFSDMLGEVGRKVGLSIDVEGMS